VLIRPGDTRTRTRSDLVARRLQLSGFKFARLMGTMTPTARDNTIKHFSTDPECTVFLISLKAGGVGINLVEGSRVIILDPCVRVAPVSVLETRSS